MVDSLRGAAALAARYVYRGGGEAGVRRGQGAPSAAEGWFERWLDAASLGAMRRRGAGAYTRPLHSST